jgi:menaquinone-dependent protoporphyrinogen oxidase
MRGRTIGAAPGPKALVTFASRHGGTREIAAAIARALIGSAAARSSGLSVALVPVELGLDPANFDAVVLGSPVYEGRWLEPAVRHAWNVVDRFPVGATWLFSSGVGPLVTAEIDDARRLCDAIGARDHRIFAGRVDRRLCTAVEREAWADAASIAGDFRDWRAVRRWAEQIAAETVLSSPVAVAG